MRVAEWWTAWPDHPTDKKIDPTNWIESETATREKLDAVTDAAPVWEPPAPDVVTPIDLWGHVDPPELPRGLLPVIIERFAVTQGDPGGLAVAALTVCAAAIADSIELQVKKHDRGWRESPRLWTALVGPPSRMKTPSIREAVYPLSAIDRECYNRYRTQLEVWEDTPKDQRDEKPRRKQVKLEDTSIEAAQEVLHDNPTGVLLVADELSGWFGAMEKYNSGGRGAAKDRGFWLQSWNGGSYSVNRISRGSFMIENLSVSLLGGIQPDLIRKVAGDCVDDGLIQRLVPIVLRTAADGKDEPRPDVAHEYAQLINRLHLLKPVFAAGWDNPSGRADRLEFDDDALAISAELQSKHRKLMALEVVNRKLAAHIGKYDAFFARLCVVFHCVEHADAGALPCVITADTASRVAKFLHGYLLRHAAAFYAGVLDMADDHDRLAAVAGYILAHKLERVTNRDVQRGVRNMKHLQRKDTEAVFEQMEALGWLFRKPAPRPADPPHWVVNPEVHRLFADRAEQEAKRRAEVYQIMKELGGAPRAA